MKQLKFINGDVREPIGESNKVICHIVNDQGLMGSGVARSLFEKWPRVREVYLKWYNAKLDFGLGKTILVRCEDDILVANMVAQHMVGVDENGNPPIRYDALIECLRGLPQMYSIHIPYKMGADRAGGDWDIIEKIIINELCSKDIDVTIYKWNK